MNKNNAREIALKIIQKTTEQHGYPNVLLNHAFKRAEFSAEDKALTVRLVYGVLENKLYLDWVIKRYSRLKSGKTSAWVYNILRMSVFQLLFMDRIPSFAVVNEGVELAKKYAGSKAAGFVNGLLRNVIRNPEKTEPPSKEPDPALHMSIKYSHPLWMVKDWIERFGQDFTQELCKANNQTPELVLRVNTLKTDRNGLAEILSQQGIKSQNGKFSDAALSIDKGTDIFSGRAYSDGLFYVQDESSMLAVEVLNPKQGQLVVDVCSAPGGKATYAAQLMKDNGKILARDISDSKLELVKENCNRLGISCIETSRFDALLTDELLVGRADRVFVDAPCSGLGIIRRKPDIKWKKDRIQYKALVKMQSRILANAARYLKPGGHLVYSTCTIMPEENQEIVLDFVGQNPRYRMCDFSELLSEKLGKKSVKNGCLQLFPNIHGTDGFFISKIVRTK